MSGRLGERVRDIREWREELRTELERSERVRGREREKEREMTGRGGLKTMFCRCQEEQEHLEEARRHLEYSYSQSKRPLQVLHRSSSFLFS